ncbi:MAG: FapA family protein [Spirochaetaceae bacterium]|nr:FapA family protein [Spirochaetaceae bacterium]
MGDQTGKVPEGKNQQNRATVLREHKNDGNISVTFSENDLEARADFMPAIGNGEPITPAYVSSVLERLNIVYGIQEKTIQETILQCNHDRKPIKDVIIARGDPPKDEVLEYFELNPHPAPLSSESKNRIDYRSQSPFVIVQKEQILAYKRPRQKGQDGKNIHGVVIPRGILRPEGVSGGQNTRTDEHHIIAEIAGQLVENKKVISVQESLVIKGAVGYATGNIIFPGDVIIEGPVSDGFKIYSGGSVTINQTFDVTDVITKNDLTVAGGIIGRGRALVKVGGALKTKFIENCRVACRKTLTVEAGIINSSIYAMENIDLGDKGIIVGGDITAIHGLRAGAIGKKSGKPTHIHCGIDFTVQQEKEKNNYQFRIISAKLSKLRELMAVPDQSPEKLAKMEELLRRLEQEQKKTSRRIADLLGRLEADDNAQVEVAGEIAPGTLIEICQIALFIQEPLRKVRIKLDKCKGKLVSEPL